MKFRSIAAAVTAVALIAGSSGCSQQANKVPQKTARVTVNDETRTSHAVSCTQVQWSLAVDISAAPAQVRAVLQLEPDGPKPQSVNIDNFNGFTGLADTDNGHAEATFASNTYHITGTAHVPNLEDPSKPGKTDFTIDVTC